MGIDQGYQTMAKMPVPDGVDDRIFRNVVSAAYTAYTMYHRLPSVQEISEFCKHAPKTIGRVVATDEFKQAVGMRGVPWDQNGGLSTEQQYCLSLLLNPTDRRTLQAKLKSAGVPYTRYRAWLKQPLFSKYMMQQSEELLSEHQGDMMVALANRGVNGDLNAIKYAMELTGRHNPSANQVVDLQRIVGLLLEVITKHVTDPAVLMSISADIGGIMPNSNSKAVIPSTVVHNDPPVGAFDILDGPEIPTF